MWAISWSPSCRLGGYFRCRCHMVWSADCSWELVSLYVLCIQYRDPAEIILPSHTIGYDVVCCVDPRGPRGSGTTHLCRRYVPGHAAVPEGGSRLMVRCRSAVDYGRETRQVHGSASPLPDVGIWDMTGCRDRYIDSVSAIVTTAAIRVCHLLSLSCRCSDHAICKDIYRDSNASYCPPRAVKSNKIHHNYKMRINPIKTLYNIHHKFYYMDKNKRVRLRLSAIRTCCEEFLNSYKKHL